MYYYVKNKRDNYSKMLYIYFLLQLLRPAHFCIVCCS